MNGFTCCYPFSIVLMFIPMKIWVQGVFCKIVGIDLNAIVLRQHYGNMRFYQKKKTVKRPFVSFNGRRVLVRIASLFVFQMLVTRMAIAPIPKFATIFHLHPNWIFIATIKKTLLFAEKSKTVSFLLRTVSELLTSYQVEETIFQIFILVLVHFSF